MSIMPQYNKQAVSASWLHTILHHLSRQHLQHVLGFIVVFSSILISLFQEKSHHKDLRTLPPADGPLIDSTSLLSLATCLLATQPQQLVSLSACLFAIDSIINAQFVLAIPTAAPPTPAPTTLPTTTTAPQTTIAPTTQNPAPPRNQTNTTSLSITRKKTMTRSQRLTLSHSKKSSISSSVTHHSFSDTMQPSLSRSITRSKISLKKTSTKQTFSWSLRHFITKTSFRKTPSNTIPTPAPVLSSAPNVTLAPGDPLAVFTNGTKISVAARPLDRLIVKIQFLKSLAIKLLLTVPEIAKLSPSFDSVVNLFTCNGTATDINQALLVLRQSSHLTYQETLNTPLNISVSNNEGLSFITAEGSMGQLGNNTAPQLKTALPESVNFPLNQDVYFDPTPYWEDIDGDEIFLAETPVNEPAPAFLISEGPKLGGQTNSPYNYTFRSIAKDWGKVAPPSPGDTSTLNWAKMLPAVTSAINPQRFAVGQQMSFTIPADLFNLAVTNIAVANIPNGMTFVPPRIIFGTPNTPQNVSIVIFGSSANGYNTVNTSFSAELYATKTILNNTMGVWVAPAAEKTTVTIPKTTFNSPYPLNYALVLLKNGSVYPPPSNVIFDTTNQFIIEPTAEQLGQTLVFGNIATNPFGDALMTSVTVRVPPNIPPRVGKALPALTCYVGSYCEYIIPPGSIESNKTLTYTVTATDNLTALPGWTYDPSVPKFYSTPTDPGGYPLSNIAANVPFVLTGCDPVNSCASQAGDITIKYTWAQLALNWGGTVVGGGLSILGAIGLYVYYVPVSNWWNAKKTLHENPFNDGQSLKYRITNKNKSYVKAWRIAKTGERLWPKRALAWIMHPLSRFLYESLMLVPLEEGDLPKSRWIVYKKRPHKCIYIHPERITPNDDETLYVIICDAEGKQKAELIVNPNLFKNKVYLSEPEELEEPLNLLDESDTENSPSLNNSNHTETPEDKTPPSIQTDVLPPRTPTPVRFFVDQEPQTDVHPLKRENSTFSLEMELSHTEEPSTPTQYKGRFFNITPPDATPEYLKPLTAKKTPPEDKENPDDTFTL